MSPFSWQGRNLCGLSLVFVKDWRVVDHFLNSMVNLGEKLDWELGRNLVHSGFTDIRSKSFIMKEAK